MFLIFDAVNHVSTLTDICIIIPTYICYVLCLPCNFKWKALMYYVGLKYIFGYGYAQHWKYNQANI